MSTSLTTAIVSLLLGTQFLVNIDLDKIYPRVEPKAVLDTVCNNTCAAPIDEDSYCSWTLGCVSIFGIFSGIWFASVRYGARSRLPGGRATVHASKLGMRGQNCSENGRDRMVGSRAAVPRLLLG